MSIEDATVLEFRLSRDIPRAIGFVFGLCGVSFLFFSIAFHNDGAPILLGVVGLLSLFIAMIVFTYTRTVRIDKRTGRIEESLACIVWQNTRSWMISEFREVGVGMGGGGNNRGGIYFVQLLGPKNLNIPGSSSNKDTIVTLAEQVAENLDIPVDKKPRMVFFQARF